MPYGKSYIIPKDELSLADMRKFRQDAIDGGVDRYINKLGGTPDELIARHAAATLDFAATTDAWHTVVLAAVGTDVSIFIGAVAPVLANSKLAVFYKVGVQTVPNPVGQLLFRIGGIAGNIIAQFDLEQFANALTPEGYFSQHVPIDPTETFACQVRPTIATGALCQLQIGCYIIEPKGTTVSPR